MSSISLDDERLQAANAAQLREMLGELLPRAQLDRLMSLWCECQTQAVRCSVPRFMERVTGELHLDDRVASQLRVKLFGAVLKQQRRTVRKPSVALPDFNPVRSPVVGKADAASQVFIGLVREVDQLARMRFESLWRELCAALVAELQGMASVHRSSGSLLAGEQTPADLAVEVISESDRQTLIHSYYLAMCQVLGPMHADRLLSDAVRTMEQQPAAAHYPPRRLL